MGPETGLVCRCRQHAPGFVHHVGQGFDGPEPWICRPPSRRIVNRRVRVRLVEMYCYRRIVSALYHLMG